VSLVPSEQPIWYQKLCLLVVVKKKGVTLALDRLVGGRCASFHQRSFSIPLSFLGGVSFSSEVILSPLAFLGVPLFLSGASFELLTVFRGCLFFSQRSFLSPLAYLGVPLFSLDVFFGPLSVFRVLHFFIGDLF
jgi:hypothetical protein